MSTLIKRRYVCLLFGKITFLSFFSPKVFSSIENGVVNDQGIYKFDINLNLFPINDGPLHVKLRPGEKVMFNIKSINKTTHLYENKSIFFKMPLISLRPCFVFQKNKQNLNLPFLVFSAKGIPTKVR
ncbi:MAG: hypothetical protein CBC01_07540 [Betaproteobacteria bacterium TMED41]|nr:MAG: hypothetical protein CBC01_07540 [Betaproteobacteria bacterium TMED41]